MPLSEDEQRILQEIEQQLYASDPELAREVSSTTVYRHAGRNLKWAALGFAAGVVLMVASLALLGSYLLDANRSSQAIEPRPHCSSSATCTRSGGPAGSSGSSPCGPPG